MHYQVLLVFLSYIWQNDSSSLMLNYSDVSHYYLLIMTEVAVHYEAIISQFLFF